MGIDEQATDIRRMFEARLITRKEYGELIQKLEAEFEQKSSLENEGALYVVYCVSYCNHLADYISQPPRISAGWTVTERRESFIYDPDYVYLELKHE